MFLKIEDNSILNTIEANHPLVHNLKNKDLRELQKEGLIIFPMDLSESEDLNDKQYLFEESNGKVRTGNVVGKLKMGKSEIDISSRFYESVHNQDYFIDYMLQKVLNYNVTSIKVNSSEANQYYDLLVYLFPFYLNEALRKGVYKEYVKRNYNDAYLKGTVDVARHIKENIPFNGKIAYKTREFSLDNSITQLIRHTIEKIEIEYSGKLFLDKVTRANIQLIKNATLSYSKQNESKIIRYNLIHPIRHGFYEEYRTLQKLCLQILSHEKSGFGIEQFEIQGIIINVAWLWEAYLSIIIGSLFVHADNIKRTGGIYVFENRIGAIMYPDFYIEDNIVLDAKYKAMGENNGFIKREDRYQLITYMYLLNARKAGIIYPTKNETKVIEKKALREQKGELFKIPYSIPQDCESFDVFKTRIKTIENNLLIQLDKVLKEN